MVVFTLQYDFSLNSRRKAALFINFDCWIEPASQEWQKRDFLLRT